MDFEIGSLVTRNSHGNDLIFTITDIIDDVYYLKGLNIRLVADATKDDLKKYEDGDIEDEKEFLDRIKPVNDLDRDDYFYLPGKILHIDGDKEYLDRCLDYYEKANIWAMGINEKEEDIPFKIRDLLEEYKPNIVIITGHDAYYNEKNKEYNDEIDYRNTFIKLEKLKDDSFKFIEKTIMERNA